MRLFILLYAFSHVLVIAASTRKLCVYQVKTRVVQTWGFVIIPCSYSKPEELDEEIEVQWLEGRGPSCQYDQKLIFPSTEEHSVRLSTRKAPYTNRTQYLEISGLKPNDGPRICCKILHIKDQKKIENIAYGTFLQFTDKEYVTQLDELIAAPGEDIVIPCNYSEKINSVKKVTWYKQNNCITDGKEIYTSENQRQHGRYSLINFPKDVSLRITNIKKDDEGGYCCAVNAGNTIKSNQVTVLLVADQKSLSAEKHQEIMVQKGEPVNLTCDYKLPDNHKNSDIVQTNVYWRVGNVTGPYAYHPYREMIHSSYINRTHLKGMANLLIEGIHTEHNTIFYCFLVFKVCKDEDQLKDIIVYGGGTKLNVQGSKLKGTSPEKWSLTTAGTSAFQEIIGDDEIGTTTTPPAFPLYLIIIIISSAIVLMIIILILIILKGKGVICRKKMSSSEQQMHRIPASGGTSNNKAPPPGGSKNTDEERKVGIENPEKETESRQTEEEEEDTFLYAKLDEAKLNDKSRTQRPKQEEVIYADVVNTAKK